MSHRASSFAIALSLWVPALCLVAGCATLLRGCAPPIATPDASFSTEAALIPDCGTRTDGGPFMASRDCRAQAWDPKTGTLWAAFKLHPSWPIYEPPDLFIPSLQDGGFDSICFPDKGKERCVRIAELATRCK